MARRDCSPVVVHQGKKEPGDRPDRRIKQSSTTLTQAAPPVRRSADRKRADSEPHSATSLQFSRCRFDIQRCAWLNAKPSAQPPSPPRKATHLPCWASVDGSREASLRHKKPHHAVFHAFKNRCFSSRFRAIVKKTDKPCKTPLAKPRGLGQMIHLARCKTSRRGCSSGVEHNLAKVGVEGSNPFARSNLLAETKALKTRSFGAVFHF